MFNDKYGSDQSGELKEIRDFDWGPDATAVQDVDIVEEVSFTEIADVAITSEMGDDEVDIVEYYTDANRDDKSDLSEEIRDWLPEINPNFDPYDYESPYCNNCGSCSYAVWRRLEGDTSICATAENIPYNDQMEALTGMEQVPMSPEEIEQRLLAQGEGAHAIIGVDRAEGPGHWFNAVCMNGKVYAVDGQSGQIRDWPPDYGNVVNWEMSVKR